MAWIPAEVTVLAEAEAFTEAFTEAEALSTTEALRDGNWIWMNAASAAAASGDSIERLLAEFDSGILNGIAVSSL